MTKIFTRKGPEILNVWAVIMKDTVIGPEFMKENFSGNLYSKLLDNVINSLMTETVESQREKIGFRTTKNYFQGALSDGREILKYAREGVAADKISLFDTARFSVWTSNIKER
jgi:hypothetical protein